MGKEEMKNKISMALKDPVLQIGFEIICKNLSELKKENTELKRIVEMVAMINKGIYTEDGIKAIYAEAEQFLKENPNELLDVYDLPS